MSDSHYDVAQICGSGHVVNSLAREFPSMNEDYCSKCGSATLTACPGCKTPIRGRYHVRGGFGLAPFTAPAFCYKCGKPFPWTTAALEAAGELADGLEVLSDEERSELKESIDDLVRETPRTGVAENKFRRLMKKAGPEAVEFMKSILCTVVSEAVRKAIFA